MRRRACFHTPRTRRRRSTARLVGEWVDLRHTTPADTALWILRADGYDGSGHLLAAGASTQGSPRRTERRYGTWFLDGALGASQPHARSASPNDSAAMGDRACRSPWTRSPDRTVRAGISSCTATSASTTRATGSLVERTTHTGTVPERTPWTTRSRASTRRCCFSGPAHGSRARPYTADCQGATSARRERWAAHVSPIVAVGACALILLSRIVLGPNRIAGARFAGPRDRRRIHRRRRHREGERPHSRHGDPAASIWATAVIGAAVGFGQSEVALVLALTTFTTLRAVGRLEERKPAAQPSDGVAGAERVSS